MIRTFHVFATLADDDAGLATIYCDDEQRFLFERSVGGAVTRREYSDDPRDFHDYVRALGQMGWNFAWAQQQGDYDDAPCSRDPDRPSEKVPALLHTQRGGSTDEVPAAIV